METYGNLSLKLQKKMKINFSSKSQKLCICWNLYKVNFYKILPQTFIKKILLVNLLTIVLKNSLKTI